MEENTNINVLVRVMEFEASDLEVKQRVIPKHPWGL
jgi:hypothetical protein